MYGRRARQAVADAEALEAAAVERLTPSIVANHR